MTAASASPSIACPRCGAANATVARFCLGCGSSLQAGAGSAPPMPPAPPVMQGASSMLGGMGSGGGSTESTVIMSAAAAFAASQQAVRTAGGVEKYAQPPASLSFEMTKKSWWATSGVTVRYDGVLQVAGMGAEQSAVRVQVKPQQGALTPILFIGAIFSLMLPFFGWGIFGLLIGAAWTGYTWNALSNAAAKEMAEKVVKGLQGGAGWRAPAPSPAPAASAPASATSVSRSAVIAQLADLGKLRDAGVLTAAEFDRKKADLLSRL
jgi:hypothetical protein